ncbi:zinc finger, CCHC-type containing protein [Tanacetum coccineum]
MLTKITKKPFQNVKCETEVLELIHSDLCDLHATPSLGTEVLELIHSDLCDLHATPSLGNKNTLFSLVPRPSLGIPNGTEDIGGLVNPKEVTEEDVTFWKEAINVEMGFIMDNNTWVLADLPPGCKPLGCKWIFKRKLKVDGTIEKFKEKLVIQGFKQKSGIDYFDTYSLVARSTTIRLLIAMASIHNLIIHQMDVKTDLLNGELEEEVYMNNLKASSCLAMKTRFTIKDMGKADVILGIRIKQESNGIAISQSYYIKNVLKKFNYFNYTLVSTSMDTSEKLMPNNGQVVSQLEYTRVIGYLMYAMTCTRSDIAFDVGKLSKYTSNPVAASKEAERSKNLLLEIPLWVKPIAPISIRCDSAATLEKSYTQMYNGKSRHLGVRHSMIHELIMNGMVSIESVRSQQNIVDHLTKRLARNLVIKSTEGIGLKSN